MTELPEIVRQRLARQAGGDHPDPDLLAAFAEGSLGPRERMQVLTHLGACATCREVVALAMPEAPATAPGVASPSAGWLRWPVLRWGAVAAAVVIVGAAVMLRAPRRATTDGEVSTYVSSKQEQNAPAAPAAEAEKKGIPVGGSVPVYADKNKDEELAAAKLKSQSKLDGLQASNRPADTRQQAAKVAQQPAPATTTNEVVVQTQAGAALADAQQRRDQGVAQQSQQFYAVVPPPPSGAQGGKLQNQGVSAQSQAAQSQVAQSQAAQSRVAESHDAMRMQQVAPAPQVPAQEARQNVFAGERAEAVPAAPAAAAAPAAPAKDLAVMRKSVARASQPPRWRTTSEGSVERSLDAGATWRVVPVQEGAGFRAVSAVGNDVWAGGAAGALYHSTNGGQSWARVVPRSGDSVLSTNIVRVEFIDNLHGVVTTASGEAWNTADGGRTWAVRRP